jgi:hypothetical protein
MVEHVHLDAEADQLRGDVRLQVGKAQHEVGLQFDNLVDLRAGECGDPGFLTPRARRAHGESRDADNACFLAQQIERFGGLLGETHDAGRVRRGHASI